MYIMSVETEVVLEAHICEIALKKRMKISNKMIDYCKILRW